MNLIIERTWEEQNIINTYKWANGHTKVKMNKLTSTLGNGCYWGMLYILCGAGLIIHIPLGIFLSVLFNNTDYGMGISMILYFVIGLLLEWYCDVQRDKIAYNTMIDNEKQMNLFRDFGVK